MLLDLYFSALEIENTEDGTDNLDDRDFFSCDGTAEMFTPEEEDLSKNLKKRKYHSLYSNSVTPVWMKGWWRVKVSIGRSGPAMLIFEFR